MRRRRALMWTGGILGTLVVAFLAGCFAYRTVMSSVIVQSALYDSVPSFVDCSRVPDSGIVESAVIDFPTFDDSEAIVLPRCEGAIIEVQYGSHTTREKIESFLRSNGTWDRSAGWWWKSIPVQLRNV